MKRLVFFVLFSIGCFSVFAQAPKFDEAKSKTRTVALLQKVQDGGFEMTEAEKASATSILVEQSAANAKCRETFPEDVDGRKACGKEASKARTTQMVTLLGEERAKLLDQTIKLLTKRPAAPKAEAAPEAAPATE